VEGELQRIVGRNIRRLRRARGVSQEDLAAEIGVHRTYMGGVERGERNLTLRSLERLAARLGVSPLSLLEDRESA
jgi:transcriptional regulator with XRE-family HTH domain